MPLYAVKLMQFCCFTDQFLHIVFTKSALTCLIGRNNRGCWFGFTNGNKTTLLV